MTSLLPQIKKISESLTIDDVQNRYSLLELFLDTVIVTDKLGKIVYINESVFNLLGYKRQELIDKNISTIIYDKIHSEGHDEYLSKLLFSTDKIPVCFGRFVDAKTKNGNKVRIYLYVGEFKDKEKYYIAILHRI